MHARTLEKHAHTLIRYSVCFNGIWIVYRGGCRREYRCESCDFI